jgi:predicted DNA-binding transcriptional regulator AlpA
MKKNPDPTDLKPVPIIADRLPVEVDEADEMLLPKTDVVARVGLSFVTLWSMMQHGKFPRARVAGNSKIFWLRSEINAWIKNRPVRGYLADADGVKMADSFRHAERRAAKKATKAAGKKGQR